MTTHVDIGALPLIECDRITKTPIRMLESSCAKRWERAQRPKAEDLARPLSFDFCKHCELGAARAGGVHVPKPVRIEEPRQPTVVERRWALIGAFFERVGAASPAQVFDYLTGLPDAEAALTPSIVRKELSGMRRKKRLVSDGLGKYRHPDAPEPEAPAPLPDPTPAQLRARTAAARDWIASRATAFRPADLLRALRAEGHPIPGTSSRAHQFAGQFVRSSARFRRIGRGLYSPAADRTATRRAHKALRAADGLAPEAMVVSGRQVLFKVGGVWQDRRGQMALFELLPVAAVDLDAANDDRESPARARRRGRG